MTTEPVGTAAWLDRMFASSVAGEIFAGHRADQAAPLFVLLGGQPAAGKTHAQETIQREHVADDLVEITGDDLREYHPDYERLFWEEPFEMPGQTAPVSGGLVARCLDYAFGHRYSVLLEGTFRDPRMVTATAVRFADAGWRVEVVAVATPAPVSRLSTEIRSLRYGYPSVGRWTPPAAHETALEHSPEVVAALEELPHVARMQVFSRTSLLYNNVRAESGEWEQTPTAADVFRTEQLRPLDDLETRRWLGDYAEVFRKAAARPGYLCELTAPTYVKLQADAERMIESQSGAAGAPAASWQQEQRERDAHLTQILSADESA